MINDSYIERNESQTETFGSNSNTEAVVIINCLLNVPLIFISIIENALVLAGILRTPSLHSPSTVFLCLLAMSDLLVGLVTQPVYIANSLKPHPSLHDAMFTTVSTITCGVSLEMMAAISVDRFMALHYHMRYPDLMTTKRAIYTSVTLWLVSILLSCLIFWNKDVFFFALATAIAICILISTLSYVQIYRIVRQHQIQIHAQQQVMQNLDAVDHDDMNMLRLKTSAMNTFIYYMCMILCYSPLLTSLLVLSMYGKVTYAWDFADTVCYMNSSINPFLYCWRLSELRGAIFKIVRNMLCKQSEENYLKVDQTIVLNG